MIKDIETLLQRIQPLYDNLNSNYSKSYLNGSVWYVGDNLIEWFHKQNNIRHFRKTKNKIKIILQILLQNK